MRVKIPQSFWTFVKNKQTKKQLIQSSRAKRTDDTHSIMVKQSVTALYHTEYEYFTMCFHIGCYISVLLIPPCCFPHAVCPFCYLIYNKLIHLKLLVLIKFLLSSLFYTLYLTVCILKAHVKLPICTSLQKIELWSYLKKKKK